MKALVLFLSLAFAAGVSSAAESTGTRTVNEFPDSSEDLSYFWTTTGHVNPTVAYVSFPLTDITPCVQTASRHSADWFASATVLDARVYLTPVASTPITKMVFEIGFMLLCR